MHMSFRVGGATERCIGIALGSQHWFPIMQFIFSRAYHATTNPLVIQGCARELQFQALAGLPLVRKLRQELTEAGKICSVNPRPGPYRTGCMPHPGCSKNHQVTSELGSHLSLGIPSVSCQRNFEM
jgi:hypothetical protein